MTDQLKDILNKRFPDGLVEDLVESYVDMIKHYRLSDWRACLNTAGVLVENVFRVLLFLRDGKVPAEVDSVDKARKDLEGSCQLPETARLLIPRVAWAIVYDKRSRKGGCHVKPCSPEYLDAHLCVHASNWILAELLRAFAQQDDEQVERIIVGLMREQIPYVDTVAGERFVTIDVPAPLEVLIHLHEAEPEGLTRLETGKSVKRSPQAVSSAIRALTGRREVFTDRSGRLHITSAGRVRLAEGLRERRAEQSVS